MKVRLEADFDDFEQIVFYRRGEHTRPAVLAYHFLRTAGGPLTAAELDSRIEEWFTRRWDASFDFEVDDGVATLRRLRLVDDGQGRLAAVRLDEAKRRLDEIWDDLFAYNAAPRAVET